MFIDKQDGVFLDQLDQKWNSYSIDVGHGGKILLTKVVEATNMFSSWVPLHLKHTIV